MFQPTTALTVDNVKSALAAGLQAIHAGQTSIDLGALSAVDSAGVATLLAWQRAAHARHQQLTFLNLPENLRSLAQLYGVSDLLYPASSHA